MYQILYPSRSVTFFSRRHIVTYLFLHVGNLHLKALVIPPQNLWRSLRIGGDLWLGSIDNVDRQIRGSVFLGINTNDMAENYFYGCRWLSSS